MNQKSSATTETKVGSDECSVPPSNATKVADRIVIKSDMNSKFHGWQSQINARFEGFGRITKNEISDFIFRKMPDDLSEADLNEIGAELYDEVQWMSWAMAKIKMARKEGVTLKLEDLIAARGLSRNKTTRKAAKFKSENLDSSKDITPKVRPKAEESGAPPPTESESEN